MNFHNVMNIKLNFGSRFLGENQFLPSIWVLKATKQPFGFS